MSSFVSGHRSLAVSKTTDRVDESHVFPTDFRRQPKDGSPGLAPIGPELAHELQDTEQGAYQENQYGPDQRITSDC